MIYGQPTATVHKLSNQATFLEKLFTDLCGITPPKFDDDQVRSDLQVVKDAHDAYAEAPHIQPRYRLFDESLYKYVYHFTFENDEPAQAYYRSIIKSLFNDVMPLIYKLKLHFQFPRPFQLAGLHKIALYPEASTSAQCPAFPSMHACMGVLLAEVCINNFPITIQYFQELAGELKKSRVAMGLCLPSDIAAGEKIAAAIGSDREFKIKYKL